MKDAYHNQSANASLAEARRKSALLRALPDFLILGVQKGGTTTLFDQLSSHPQVVGPAVKEIQFFSFEYHRGKNWYRSHFPLVPKLWWWSVCSGKRCLTGEGSPPYLYHPLVPARVVKVVPKAKFIVLLRDPVARAYSHYEHNKALGRESLDFSAALAAEERRTSAQYRAVVEGNGDPADPSFLRYAYRARGCYAEQLKRWFNVFPREQFLILKSESLFTNGEAVLSEVCEFLGIANHQFSAKKSNAGSYRAMPFEATDELRDYYRPRNYELSELLGEEFLWT
jgi:hypothetical protein